MFLKMESWMLERIKLFLIYKFIVYRIIYSNVFDYNYILPSDIYENSTKPFSKRIDQNGRIDS